MSPKRSKRLHLYGHAGGHLRDALLNALEYRFQDPGDWWNHIEIDFTSERDQRWLASCSPKRRAQWLLGQLWHCTDIVPSYVSRQFIESGEVEKEVEVCTYARLARFLARDLKPIGKATREEEK